MLTSHEKAEPTLKKISHDEAVEYVNRAMGWVTPDWIQLGITYAKAAGATAVAIGRIIFDHANPHRRERMMKQKEYIKQASKTAPDKTGVMMLNNCALGMSGELSEMIGLLDDDLDQPVLAWGGTPGITPEKIRGELGDFLWYLAMAQKTIGICQLDFEDLRPGQPVWEKFLEQSGMGSATWAQVVITLQEHVGDLCDHLKKHIHQGHVFEAEKMVVVLTRIAALVWVIDNNPSKTRSENIEKLRSRYPDGFSEERSKDRA